MKLSTLHNFKKHFVKVSDQQQAGLACLASVIQFYGGQTELDKLSKNSGAAENGVTLYGLSKAARLEGFKAEGFKANVESLKKVDKPIILHVSKDAGGEDFVVFYGWQNNKFIIGDPRWGIIEYREEELEAVWSSKTLILLEPDTSFKTIKDKKKLKQSWFWNLIKKRKKIFVTLLVLGFVSFVLFLFAFPLIIQSIDEIKLISKNLKSPAKPLVATVLVFVVLILNHIKSVFANFEVNRFNSNLIGLIAESRFFSENDYGKINYHKVAALNKAAGQFSSSLLWLVSNGLFYFLLFIYAFILLSTLSVFMGLLIVTASVVALFIFKYFGNEIEKLITARNKSEIENAKTQRNILSKSELIKLSNSETHFKSKMIHSLKQILEPKLTMAQIQSEINFWLFCEILIVLVFGFVIVAIFGSDNFKMYRLQTLVSFIIFSYSLIKLKEFTLNFYTAKVHFNYLYKNIDTDLLLSKDAEENDCANENLKVSRLEIKNLKCTFSGMYPVLHNFNLIAEIGNITSVYGNTGSGKSVLVSVLSRLLPLTDGEIVVNESTWEYINNRQWRNIISVVLQPAQLFDIHVIRNIAWGAESFDPKRIISFCKEFGFHDFIKAFPDGYATNSESISVGQKQLVMLASALYRKPKILFLDEPFSEMDTNMKEFCLQLLQSIKNEILVLVFTGDDLIKQNTDKVFCL